MECIKPGGVYTRRADSIINLVKHALAFAPAYRFLVNLSYVIYFEQEQSVHSASLRFDCPPTRVVLMVLPSGKKKKKKPDHYVFSGHHYHKTFQVGFSLTSNQSANDQIPLPSC